MTTETILTNPTETELANAVQENLFALFWAMAEVLPDGEIVENDKLGLTGGRINRYLWRNR